LLLPVPTLCGGSVADFYLGLDKGHVDMFKICFTILMFLLLGACTSASEPERSELLLYDTVQHEVVVNGNSISVGFLVAPGESIPTHVQVSPVIHALGEGISFYSDLRRISMDGFFGEVSFAIGEYEFHIEGRQVTLDMPSIVVGAFAYVPIEFFSDVLGIENVYFEDGKLFIYN